MDQLMWHMTPMVSKKILYFHRIFQNISETLLREPLLQINGNILFAWMSSISDKKNHGPLDYAWQTSL